MQVTVGAILAGGRSERFKGSGTPKQFVKVGGIPLMMYSIAAFESCKDIKRYVIAAPREWHGQVQEWLDRFGGTKFHTFTMPGKTRQHSIYNALQGLQSLSPEYVIVHDAARPFITEFDITVCARIPGLENVDGATPALPVAGTVYQSADGKTITGLLNRDELSVGLTPECYDFQKYLQAHKELSDEALGKIRGSSEIAFNAGMKIRLFPGNPNNVKITTADDLAYFKYIIESGKKKSV